MIQSIEDLVELQARTRSQKRTVRQLPRLLRLSFRMTWSAGPRLFFAMVALTVLLGTGAGAVLLAARSGVDGVLRAAAEGDDRLPAALLGLVPLVAVTSARAVLQSVDTIVHGRLGGRVRLAAQEQVLTVASEVDLLRFESPEFSNRVRQATAAGDQVTSAVMAAVSLLGSAVTVVGLSAALVSMAPGVVLLLAVACVPGWWGGLRMARSDYDLLRRQVQDSRVVQYLQSVLVGRDEAKEIRAFGLGPGLLARWRERSELLLEESMVQQRHRASIGLLTRALDAVLFAVVAAAVVWQVVAGATGLAAATAVLYGVQQLRGAVRNAIASANRVYAAGLLLADLDALTREADEHRSSQPTEPVPGPFGTLSVERVTFRYPGSDEPALCDVSLELRAGEIVALVGENGSGKTTLAKLLAGLYRPTTGAIRWDGVDVAGCDPESVRRHVAVIFQDFVRWELTVAENIGLGSPGGPADRIAVEAAARAAGAHELVVGLPQGYDTVLTKTLASAGADLSVGQWQRLAIARAMCRQAPFIVLDEPTAALDPRAEHELFEKIRELCAGRSVLLISHRFSSVRSADRIYVLDGGRVVEHGAHRDLMAAGGLYAELFTLQAAAYLDPPASPLGAVASGLAPQQLAVDDHEHG